MRKSAWNILVCRHDAFFFFHTINAFESGDDLCVDLAAYENTNVIVHLHRANLLFNRQEHPPVVPRRYASCVTAPGRMMVTNNGRGSLPTAYTSFFLDLALHPFSSCLVLVLH